MLKKVLRDIADDVGDEAVFAAKAAGYFEKPHFPGLSDLNDLKAEILLWLIEHMAPGPVDGDHQ